MSSSHHHYYSSSSSSSRNIPSDDAQLPPLRTVLGDQLALPVHESRYSSAGPYESHTSRRDSGSASGGYYASHPMSSSSTGGYRSSYGYHHCDVDPTHHHGQMNKEDVKKYVCTWDGCGKRFERQNALDTHMNIHTDSKPFQCPVCGKVFNVRSNMRRHLLTHKDYIDPSVDVYGDIPYSKPTSSGYYSSR